MLEHLSGSRQRAAIGLGAGAGNEQLERGAAAETVEREGGMGGGGIEGEEAGIDGERAGSALEIAGQGERAGAVLEQRTGARYRCTIAPIGGRQQVECSTAGDIVEREGG